MPYPILTVEADSVLGDEQMGSKPKVWFQLNGENWLFKEAREATGEDWAEKVVAEVAREIAIPAARVELAVRNGRRRSASQSFLQPDDNLMHGNELLFIQVAGYDQEKKQHQSDHTLENIVRTIQMLFEGQVQIQDGVLEDLASYVVLDALVGNTDRHHENWGLVWRVVQAEGGAAGLSLFTAPSFDHASSLGRELTDASRLKIMSDGNMDRYIFGPRARGGIYLRNTDKYCPSPFRLAQVGSRLYPNHFRPALAKIAACPLERLLTTVDEVPESRMSEVAKTFAKEYMSRTRAALEGLMQ